MDHFDSSGEREPARLGPRLEETNVTYGVKLENVTAGGPAYAAGLKAGTKTAVVRGSTYLIGGDVIVARNRMKIIDLDALSSYV